jgi:hypothetical protein
MHFPNVPPSADNLTDFATKLFLHCKDVTYFFRNKVQPPKSKHGRLTVTGTDSDTSIIDKSQFEIQIIDDINNRTLCRLAPKATKVIGEGFEPWYWVAGQLTNHPPNHIMAGPFKQEDKAEVADQISKWLPPFVVIVEGVGEVDPKLLEVVRKAMTGMDDTGYLLVVAPDRDNALTIEPAKIERATLTEDLQKVTDRRHIPVGLVVTQANRTKAASMVFDVVNRFPGVMDKVRNGGMKLASQLLRGAAS